MSYLRILLFALILSPVVLTSCKLNRAAVETAPEPLTDSAIAENPQVNEFDFVNLSCNFNAEYIADSAQQTFSGTIRILKDSIIWVSVRKMGIEGMRLLIRPDSVFYINRLDKSYIASDFSAIEKLFDINLNYYILESLLTGNDLNNYNKVQADVIKHITNDKELTIERLMAINPDDTLATGQKLYQRMKIDRKSMKITEMTYKQYQDKRSVVATYNVFEELPKGIIPYSLNYMVTTQTVTGIKLSVNKWNVDKEGLKFPFSIPSTYTKAF